MKNHHFDALISTYSTYNFEKTSPDETLKVVYEKMVRTGQYMLPVVEEHKKTTSDEEAVINQSSIMGVVDLPVIEALMRKE